MLKTFLAAFTRRSLQRMPALPAEFWSKVKVRWRHNPGFVAAAAAGSIGLVLAVVLGIQGAFRLLDGEPAGADLADPSLSAALGDPENDLDGTRNKGIDPGDEPGAIRDRIAARPARNVQVLDELESTLDDEDEPTSGPPKKVAARDTRIQKRDPFDTDEELGAEEQPVRVKPRARHVLDENPLADEEELSQKAVQFPVEVDDEQSADDGDAEPAMVAANSSADKTEGRPTNSGPSFGGDGPEETEEDAAENPSAPPAANGNPEPPRGWKHPLSRPDSATEPSAAIAQKSREVETVIYATPDAGESAAVDRTAATNNEVAPRRLTLEIAGPGAARVGETCNFEIRVKNAGRTVVEKITLSVELPAELVHEVAQTLEQKVEAIGPGKTYRALVRTRAKAAGKATLKTDVAIQGRVDAAAAAKIEIGGASGARAKAASPVRN